MEERLAGTSGGSTETGVVGTTALARAETDTALGEAAGTLVCEGVTEPVLPVAPQMELAIA